MTKILANDLGKDLASALAEFITASSPTGDVNIHGTSLDVNALTNKEIKFLLHKFLHAKSLNEFGVLDTAGIFEVVHIKEGHHEAGPVHENLKSTMPFWPPYNVHPVKPSEMIEWQGSPPPTKRVRFKKKD